MNRDMKFPASHFTNPLAYTLCVCVCAWQVRISPIKATLMMMTTTKYKCQIHAWNYFIINSLFRIKSSLMDILWCTRCWIGFFENQPVKKLHFLHQDINFPFKMLALSIAISPYTSSLPLPCSTRTHKSERNSFTWLLMRLSSSQPTMNNLTAAINRLRGSLCESQPHMMRLISIAYGNLTLSDG